MEQTCGAGDGESPDASPQDSIDIGFYAVRVEKPYALARLWNRLPGTFLLLKETIGIPDRFEFQLESIDSTDLPSFSDRIAVGAFALRKIQLLRVCARAGQATTSDIVIGLCAEILRSLDSLLPGVLDPHLTPDPDPCAAFRPIVDDLLECGRVLGSLIPGREIVVLV
jgi:hypothetical protein